MQLSYIAHFVWYYERKCWIIPYLGFIIALQHFADGKCALSSVNTVQYGYKLEIPEA